MKCSVCGAEIPAGSLFCPNCGTRIAAPPGAGAPTEALPAARPEPPALDQPYAERPDAPRWPVDNQPPVAPQWATPSTFSGPVGAPNSTAAIVSLIFGILSWVALPGIGPIVAVVAGHMARGEIRRSNGQVGGGGMAMVGLVLGYAQLALLVLLICAIVAIGALTLLGSRVQSR